MNTSILVTGGLGYIGSHTVVDLISKGYEVTIVDDLSNSYIDVLSNIERITGVRPDFYQIDLLDYASLTSLFQKKSFGAVIHFAAHLFVDESVKEPLKYYENNLISLLNVLKLMREFEVKHLVFSSSCTVYGNPEFLPVTEETPIGKASSPYGTTKIMGEKILHDVCMLNENVSAISLRYFNPVGAHSSGLIGELPKSEPKHLFPLILNSLEENKKFKIFGGDYNTLDGSAVRDYIHVEDVAEAHSKALERILENKNITPVEYYNIGKGKGISVKEVLKAFEEIMEIEIPKEVVKRREGDVSNIFANSKLAEERLDWKAKRDVKEMVRSTLKWEETKNNREWK